MFVSYLISFYSSHTPIRHNNVTNIVLVPILLPKQPWPVKARTPLDPWRYVVVSGTKMLAADPLSPVSCEVGPPWIGIVCSEHPTDARLDWDLKAKSTPQTHCCAPQTIPETFLLCGRVHYPAERGHSHQRIQNFHERVDMVCINATWCKKTGFIRPGHLLPLLRGPVLMLTCPLLALSVVDRGQHGHPDWSAAVQPHTQQTAMHCVFWHLSIRTSINFLSNLSYSSSSVGSDHTINEPRPPMTLSPVHHCSFLGALLIDTDHCRPGTPHKSCSFGDALTQSSQFGPCQTRSNPYACPC